MSMKMVKKDASGEVQYQKSPRQQQTPVRVNAPSLTDACRAPANL